VPQIAAAAVGYATMRYQIFGVRFAILKYSQVTSKAKLIVCTHLNKPINGLPQVWEPCDWCTRRLSTNVRWVEERAQNGLQEQTTTIIDANIAMLKSSKRARFRHDNFDIGYADLVWS